MQKTAMNPNPEQEMAVNPFAQEQTAEIQPQENAQTYPVEVDGDIVELTLEELIDAAAQGLSKRNAYIRRNRAANAMPNGQIYAAFVDIPMSVPRTFRSRYGSGRSRKARSCPRTASGRLPS